MSNSPKRSYISEKRQSQAIDTKEKILNSAKKLFETKGVEDVTIDSIAKKAGVSTPTVYACFQSKLNIIRFILDEVVPEVEYEGLIEKIREEKIAANRFKITAMMARKFYDAEKKQMDLFRGATILSKEFKKLEKEREERRFKRQEESIKIMIKEKSLKKGLSAAKARGLLWALTGRDLYRLLVIEQNWPSKDYEIWLSNTLSQQLIDS